ncbi:hypothetical protein EBR43_13775 [bacterium]|nr:hypothetical protein [bacterium]
MSFYKTTTTLALTAGQSGSLAGNWGVLPAAGTSPAGTITLQPTTLGGTTFPTMSIAHLATGVPFVCNLRSISVTGGTVYLLA